MPANPGLLLRLLRATLLTPALSSLRIPTLTIIIHHSRRRTRNNTEHILHLLQRPPHRLWIKRPNHNPSSPIKRHKAVKVIRPQPRNGNRRALRKDQIQRPVGGRGERGASRADGRGEDLGLVDPRDQAQGGEEEGEDAEHADGGAEGVFVSRWAGEIKVPCEGGFDAHCGAHAEE